MQRHIFHMRLTCEYAEENAIADLRVEHLEEGDWKSLELGTLTPGFLIFTYAVFTCQHMFLRANATERNLLLAASHGSILIDGVDIRAYDVRSLRRRIGQVLQDVVLFSGGETAGRQTGSWYTEGEDTVTALSAETGETLYIGILVVIAIVAFTATVVLSRFIETTGRS